MCLSVLAWQVSEAAAQPTRTQPARTESTSSTLTEVELTAARQLFVEGIALEKEHDWDAALEKFERVAKLRRTPQVRFHIALCHEHLGRLVEAINGFELAALEAQRLGNQAKDVLQFAPARARKLRKRVAYLKLEIKGHLRTSKIMLDGRELASALIGTNIPVDPGNHVLEVRRGQETTFHRELPFDPAETHRLVLTIDDPEPGPAIKKRQPPSAAGPGQPESRRLPAYLVGGVGLGTLAVSAVLWGMREGAISDVQEGCRGADGTSECDPADQQLAGEAQDYDVASKVLLGVGTAALAAGVVLWFELGPSSDPAATPARKGARRHLGIVPTPGGLGLVGSF